ncbi:MAG TPA: ribosomal protein S18-alanine N-acetyltransferase [Oscillospiraceae bacterium]|nr:ribosomal protein S18-alanine N-acetyltransferase [Oscillospiraceae bacterium]
MENELANIVIDKMTAEDTKALSLLEKESFLMPWSEDAFMYELTNEKAFFLTAKSDGKVLGYIGSHLVLDECYITNIAVFSEYRQKGIAKRLIKELCRLLKEKGASFVTLEVRKSNIKAINLYEKLGFVFSGIIKNGSTKPPEDTIIYTLTLNGGDSL